MIRISTEKIDVITRPGESVQGQFHISAPAGKRVHGLIMSDHARIVTDLEEFTGREIKVRYGIDVKGLSDGSTVTGRITLATDEGELDLPVQAAVQSEALRRTDDGVHSLREFTELAAQNPPEAFRIFKSPVLDHILSARVGESRQNPHTYDRPEGRYLTLLKGLRLGALTPQRMEEFLVLTGQKRRVDLKLVNSRADYYGLTDSVQETATIRRSVSWGETSIDVTADCDFIELPTGHLTEEDFIGSVCDLDYVINFQKLGTGRRVGRIFLTGCGQELTLDVTASRYGEHFTDETTLLNRHRAEIWEALLDYEIGAVGKKGNLKGNISALLARCLPELDGIRPLGANERKTALLEAYLKDLSGNRKEALAALQGMTTADFQDEDLEVKGFYLYLSDKLNRLLQETSDTAGRIRELAIRDPKSWILMKLVWLTDEDTARTPLVRLAMMRTAYKAGCRSPFLYAEALKLLLSDDSLLTQINSFARQVLLFAARRRLLTRELALRAAFLSENEKRYTPVLYRVLAEAYEENPLDGILEAICRLLMKGPSRDSLCFPWYALAVERNIRITRLYEYYIETIPESWQKILPLPIRKYFIYNDTLSEQNRAFVYANVVRNRVEDPETFDRYQDKIRSFAQASLYEGRLNGDYATLYQEFITEVTDGHTAEMLAGAIFAEGVYCDDRSVRNAVMVHRQFAKEEIVPLVRGKAYVHRYTGDAELFFEDAMGRRFRSPVSYSVEPLMEQGDYARVCRDQGAMGSGLILHTLADEKEVTAQTLAYWQRASESPDFSDKFRNRARRLLLRYYLDHASDYHLDDAVANLDDEICAGADKVLFLEVLLSRGLYDRAYHLINTFGPEGLDGDRLASLTDRMIDEKEFREDEDLLLLCAAVWKEGHAHERILSYLVKYFNGAIDLMIQLQSDAEAAYVETTDLDERILARALFSHLDLGADGSKILRRYMEGGGSVRLIRSFLDYASKLAFDGTEPVDPYLAECLISLFGSGSLSFVQKMTLLRYYSQHGVSGAEQELQVDSMLEECRKQNLVFKCFQDLPKSFVTQYGLEDKVIVEEQADPDDLVTLHYKLDTLSGEDKTEPMTCVYRGIFQKTFTLFYGEKLTYFVTIQHGEEVRETKPRTLTSSFIDLTGTSRYQLLNRMLKLEREGKTAEMKEELQDYLKQEKLMEHLFHLEEDI